MTIALDAGAVVTNCLRTVEPDERIPMLKELLAHVAASMVALEGRHVGTENIYRMADAMVSTEPSER